MNKKIVLERAACKNAGGIGSFGFSVMGGATAKLPAVVCSIEVGGPAAESKQVFYYWLHLLFLCKCWGAGDPILIICSQIA